MHVHRRNGGGGDWRAGAETHAKTPAAPGPAATLLPPKETLERGPEEACLVSLASPPADLLWHPLPGQGRAGATSTTHPRHKLHSEPSTASRRLCGHGQVPPRGNASSLRVTSEGTVPVGAPAAGGMHSPHIEGRMQACLPCDFPRKSGSCFLRAGILLWGAPRIPFAPRGEKDGSSPDPPLSHRARLERSSPRFDA